MQCGWLKAGLSGLIPKNVFKNLLFPTYTGNAEALFYQLNSKEPLATVETCEESKIGKIILHLINPKLICYESRWEAN